MARAQDNETLIDRDAPDLVGATLPGGWRVQRHVSTGSFGHVYEGRHLDDGPASVAIKVLHTNLVSEPEVALRFRREADILEAIESPSVPRLFDRGRDPRGRPFFVMEFLKGRELGVVLAEAGSLPARQALSLVEPICEALVAAHKAGITHRDLKPENVMVQPDGVKIFDFSVSKVDDVALTQPGTILGTPSYMSPEQALGEPVTVQFDVYAVGAVLYELLTGRPPFRGADAQKTLLALLTEEAPRPRAIDVRIAPEVETLVLSAIARDPRARIPDMSALLDQVRAVRAALDRANEAETLPTVTVEALRATEAQRAVAPPSSVPAPVTGVAPVLAAPTRAGDVRTPANRSDALYWALGCALMGAALVVLAKALALPAVPLWLALVALVPGYLVGRVVGRSLHSFAL